jgi:hypothetical protein
MESQLADIAASVGYTLLATNMVAYPLKAYYRHFSYAGHGMPKEMRESEKRGVLHAIIPTPFDILHSYASSVWSDFKRSSRQ